MHERCAAHEAPDVSIEAAEFLLDLEKSFGVADRRGDLRAIADDAVVFQQRFHLPLAKAGNYLRIETGECFAIRVALAQHRIPAQPCLRAFESKKFEDGA